MEKLDADGYQRVQLYDGKQEHDIALRGRKIVPVPIGTGLTDQDHIEVTSGLTEQDTVLVLSSTAAR